MDNASFWFGIMTSEGLGFAGSLFKGIVSGAGLGIVGVGAAYLLYRILGLLPKEGGGARKIVTLAWLLMALPIVGGFIGYNNGFSKGAYRFVTEGEFSEEVMPQVSSGIADVVFQLDDAMAGLLGESVHPDRTELNVQEFLNRRERAADKVVTEVLPALSENVKAQHSFLQDGVPESVLDWFIRSFGEELVRGKAVETADKFLIKFPLSSWFKDLSKAAAAEGDVETISREALSEFTVESVLVACVVRPIEVGVRLQNAIGYGAAALVLVLPAGILFLLRNRTATDSVANDAV